MLHCVSCIFYKTYKTFLKRFISPVQDILQLTVLKNIKSLLNVHILAEISRNILTLILHHSHFNSQVMGFELPLFKWISEIIAECNWISKLFCRFNCTGQIRYREDVCIFSYCSWKYSHRHFSNSGKPENNFCFCWKVTFCHN